MAPHILWFIAGLVLLGLELASGTFYLLILAVAAGGGGLAGLLGLPLSAQFAIAAAVGIGGSLWLRRIRGIRSQADKHNQDLDLGHPVKVISRNGSNLRVRYRGADWDADLEGEDSSGTETLFIVAREGNRLRVSANRQEH